MMSIIYGKSLLIVMMEFEIHGNNLQIVDGMTHMIHGKILQIATMTALIHGKIIMMETLGYMILKIKMEIKFAIIQVVWN